MSFLLGNWRDLAASTGALKGLPKDRSAENLQRVLLMHLGCGHSLRETVVGARHAQFAELSSAALRDQLRKARVWLQALCLELVRERGVPVADDGAKCGRSTRRRRMELAYAVSSLKPRPRRR